MTEELQIRQNLIMSEYYLKHIEENETNLTDCQIRIDQSNKILQKNIREGLINFSNETIISFAETAIKVQGKAHLSEEFVNYFFQRNSQSGQFYVRALLLKAKIIMTNGQKEYLKAEDMIKNLKKSFECIQKAIDIVSQNKQKYQFLIYNISVVAYQICHSIFRIQWQKYFLEYVEKIEKLLEELNDPDQEWRCKFSLILFQCLYDADKKADAVKVFERICDNAKKNNLRPEFQEYLLRLRISYGKENPPLLASAKKEVDSSPDKSIKILFMLQQMKSGLIAEATIEKELVTLITGITGGQLENQQNPKLNDQFQIRLAEAGRVALKFNLIQIADNIVAYLTRVRHSTLKAFIMNEYNKAELLVKKSGSIIDEKTGMKLSSQQIKKQEIAHGIQALKMLEKVMLANKKSNDADLIYEGAILIWNIGIPFLNANYRKYCYQAFLQASKFLEMIQCSDSALRVNFHLELAKSDIQQDDLVLAQQQILKALSLDYSIPLTQVKVKYEQDEDLSLFQRPYDRVLKLLQQKVDLKMGTYAAPKNDLEKAVLDLDKVQHQDTKKSQQIENLQRTFYGVLINLEEKEYYNDPENDLVDIEIEQEKKLFKQEQLNQFKQKKLLAAEVAKIAFELDQIDLSIDACKFVCKDQWELRNASDLILSQTECYFIWARCIQEKLSAQGYEIAYKDLIKKNEDGEEYLDNEADQELVDQINSQKKEIIDYYVQGLKLAESLQQSWILFNGAIYIWNSYINYFKYPQNDSKLLPEIITMLKEYFDIMKNCLKELEKKQITDYDMEAKIKVYANLSMVYARLNEAKNNFEEVMRVCESVLSTPINSQTRKNINAMKARVQGNSKQPVKQPDKKGAAPGTQLQGSDSVIFEVVQQLEVIQNTTNKGQVQELIKKCYDSLQQWQVKENDETELELHAEIWTRFARLALNEDNSQMSKYSLKAVDSALVYNKDNVPTTRLRWYSLVEHIYSETLLKLLNPESQEADAQKKILKQSLEHAVQAIKLGSKSNYPILIINSAKLIWNICEKLQDTAENRKDLIQPIQIALQNLKNVKGLQEPDLVLLLSQLFFQACFENEQYKLGEAVADSIFELVPKEQQKPIWEAKTIFISKQGKNELQAISNMREADNSLQAKMWIRLARASTNVFKQYNAYKTAIDLLKKEYEYECVEVYIELSEWLLRNSYSKELIQENLQQAGDILIEIELDEEGSESEDDNNESIFSRSSRGKKSFSKQSNLQSRATKKESNKQKSSDNKTQKTQQKSIFQNRQEDQHPQSLNCFHLERLIRIHAMMAMIADNQDSQLQFCIDVYTFIMKTFQVSYDFLNKQDEQKKFELPQKFDDWINYQKPKEFIECIKTQEDANIISKYVFEKAEMTFFYVDHVISTFEQNGLQIYTIPIFQFQMIIAGEIIKNKYLLQAIEARYSRTLNFLGMHTKSEQIIQQINFKNINITNNDKINLLNKTKSQKTSSTKTGQGNTPVLIKKVLPHHTWIMSASELINQGELSKARMLLQEAQQHANILQENNLITKIKIYIAQIEYIEGNYKGSLETYMETHKLNKDVKLWQQICIGTVQVLQKLNQIQDVTMFLDKFTNILIDIQNKPQNSYQKLDIQQTLIICYILKARCIAKKLRNNFSWDLFMETFNNIGQIEKFKCGLNHQHINLLTKFYNKLTIMIEQQSVCDQNQVEKCYKIIFYLIDRLMFLEKNVKSQLKYTAILEKQSFEIQGPIQIQYSKIKILLARCYVYNGIMKNKLRKMNVNFEIQSDLPKETDNELVTNYIKKLNHIIERSIMPIPKRLDSFEKAIAIITSILPKINHKHYLYLIASVELARAKRYLADQRSQMNQVWQQDEQNEQEDEENKKQKDSSFDFRLESFNYIREIIGNPEFANIDNPFMDTQSYYHAKKLHKENLENFGIQHSETTFESLSKFQHISFMEKMLQVIKKEAPNNYKPFLLQKLQKTVVQNFNQVNQDILNFMQKEFKVWNLLFSNVQFNDVKEKLPNGSAYLILQLDHNNEFLYIGLLSISQSRQFKFNCQKKLMSQKDLDIISNFKQNLDQIKQVLIKTPMVTEQDLLTIEDEENQNLQNMMQKFEEYFSFISEFVNPFINEVQKEEEVDVQAQAKGAKDVKKGGKGGPEIQAKELKKSASGIESLVLLLDNKLQSLPFEKLNVFKEIGAKSRDTSFLVLGKRYMNLNYQPDTKSINGLVKDKLRYIGYDFKNKEINFGNMIEQIQKQLSLIKFQGTSSSKRIASFGEWSKELQNNTMMVFYAHEALFDILSPQLFFNLIEINNTKSFIIQDNINSLKMQINKSTPLDADSQKIPLNEQHEKLYLFLTLIGASSIALNQWSIKPEENIKQIESQIKSLDQGNVMAATLNDYQENQKMLYSHNQVFYGVPINRLS